MFIWTSFESLLEKARQSSASSKTEDPIITNLTQSMKAKADNILQNVKTKLIVPDLSDNEGGVTTRSKESNLSYNNQDDYSEKNTTSIVNWIVKIVKSLVDKVNENANFMKYLAEHVSLISDSTKENIHATNILNDENTQLKQKIESLELECDESRQRGMKGNLIISCPVNEASRLKIPNSPAGLTNESELQMVIRLVKTKTNIEFSES